jgi:mannose-6-phosphate isomerase-like protein (cupin superfamily)
MTTINLQSSLSNLSKLDISAQTTSEDANNSMKMLGEFNQCMMGLAYFSGRTPWEWHPDDELLQVLEGEVDVTILSDSGTQEVKLPVGEIFMIPKGLWHRQNAPDGVKLMFITSQEGNRHSEAINPTS